MEKEIDALYIKKGDVLFSLNAPFQFIGVKFKIISFLIVPDSNYCQLLWKSWFIFFITLPFGCIKKKFRVSLFLD